jgi:hypothetical protein
MSRILTVQNIESSMSACHVVKFALILLKFRRNYGLNPCYRRVSRSRNRVRTSETSVYVYITARLECANYISAQYLNMFSGSVVSVESRKLQGTVHEFNYWVKLKLSLCLTN